MPHLFYIGIILMLSLSTAVALQANKPHSCEQASIDAHMEGYTKGIVETTRIFQVIK